MENERSADREPVDTREAVDRATQEFRETRFADAERSAQKAVSLARSSGERLAEAVALAWLGAAMTQQSRYQDALLRLEESIDILDTIGRSEYAGRPLNYMAVVYEEMGDFDVARGLYERAIDAARRAGDHEVEGRALANLGEALVNRELWDEAEPIILAARDALEKTGESALVGWTLQVEARVHMGRGNNEAALGLLQKALAHAERDRATRLVGEILTGLGTLYSRLGRFEEAIDHLRRALEQVENADVRLEIYKTHLALSQVYEQLGDFAKALDHHKEYHRVYKSVADEIWRTRIGNLTAELNLEKARHEREISKIRTDELTQAIEKLTAMAGSFENLSIHDSLTSAYNRRYLETKLTEEFERSRRYRTPLSLAMGDIDRFKRVNDMLSHAVGDQVLKEIARVMTTGLRRSDVLVRYGGEEFVILFPGTSLANAVAACEKIRVQLETHDWSAIDPRLETVTLSFGAADASDADTPESLIATADTRLYESKRQGRNRVVPAAVLPPASGD